ncbi:MAG: methyltransferase [Phenylobacterium sp.]|uniref:methyltransferase n=1 Tax=Phenylobacterium sp. TaxID=1871053 RepID=UPI001A4364EE|nr:methyltransferase [Phenylobacterium sp.]MBL8770293.1 methyltransferase [Phenylobacterium sp.]
MTDPSADATLLELLAWLEADGYAFVTPTPLTHARILARDGHAPARDVRDALGWSRDFAPDVLPRDVFRMLQAAGMLEARGPLYRSRVRVSRVRGRLFLHSAYPTDDQDAVFLGPDSYRFADLVARELPTIPVGPIADVGGGAGVGAITAGGLAASRLLLTDVNPRALRLARLNAAHAHVQLEVLEADGLDGAPDGLGVVIANPPYIADADQTYASGGRRTGGELSLAWTRAALEKLAPGGRLILYTGSAIGNGGRDALHEGLADIAATQGADMDYRELDPDVFGEELERPAYAAVERIAAVACVMTAGRG